MKRTKYLVLVFILVLGLASCSDQENETKEIEETTLTHVESTTQSPNYAGNFKGTAPAYHGDLNLTVTLDEQGVIKNIIIDDNEETEGMGTVALKNVSNRVIENQSLDVDVVTGATISSYTVLDAIADAVKNAGLNPEDIGYVKKTYDFIEMPEFDAATLPVVKEKTDQITIVDAKKREVVIDLPISRYAVSTMDVVDFIIPLIGEEAFHKLVGSGQSGSGSFQTYGLVYEPIVGNFMSHVGQISTHNAPFDLEMILATAPDVLIVNSAMGAHKYALEVEDILKEAGIQIVLINVPGKSMTTSVQNTEKILGKIFQASERANEVNEFIDAQYQVILSEDLLARSDSPSVYYEKSGFSEIFGPTKGSNKGWGELIKVAGGRNIADPIIKEKSAKKVVLDPEMILEANPDFIILSSCGAGWMDHYPGNKYNTPTFDLLNRPGWSELQAVKNKNVHELAHAMNRSIFSFEAVQVMAKLFYPTLFEELNPEENMKEFFERFMLIDSDITTWHYPMP